MGKRKSCSCRLRPVVSDSGSAMKAEDSENQAQGSGSNKLESTDGLCRVVIPGDLVEEIPDEKKVILGPGLTREGVEVRAIKCGLLKSKGIQGNHPVFWVDTHNKRYVPVKGENVLGIVTAKGGDNFRVDIGTAESASLSYLAFESATKKNRPNVNVGDVVYAKLIVASKDMEPELVCVDGYGKKAGMGVLEDGGYVFSVSLNTVRKLLSKECVLLQTLGKQIPFEIAVGTNGRIWIRGKSVSDTICIANAIEVSEHMSNQEITRMSQKLVDNMTGF